ncbi:hypothetical protein GQ457_08G027970 [Hibiscus cannabinus]
MKIIFWKCRGLGTEVKWPIIRRLVRIYKIEMLLLQETKVSTFDLDKARKLLGDMEVDFPISPTVGKWNSLNVEVVMVNVYHLWIDLLALKSLHSGKWIAGGDYNTVCHKERSGCSQSMLGMRNFNKFIDEATLIYLPLHEKKFTWFGSMDVEHRFINAWLEKDDCKKVTEEAWTLNGVQVIELASS